MKTNLLNLTPTTQRFMEGEPLRAIGFSAGIWPADTELRVALVLVAADGRPRTSVPRRNQMQIINLATDISGMIKACRCSWTSLIALSMFVGLLAAIVVPVYVH